MKKQTVFIGFAMCIVLLAAACARPAADITPAAEPVSTEAPAVPETAPADVSVPAYASALTVLFETGVLPDGTVLAGQPVSDNSFAVADVDGDGREELLLALVTESTAGQMLNIYDFDGSELTVELSEYPLLTFYDNGVIRADWSHNQGLAGEFWPYTLYRYDVASDVYQNIGMVDAWSRAFAETDAQGAAFPADIDVSGTGVVYYLMENGVYETVPPVDASVYTAWRGRYLDGASEVYIPFTPLTADAIAALTNGGN